MFVLQIFENLRSVMFMWIVGKLDVYLVGTVMLIFGMGLYGLFISNESNDGKSDRALKNTTLFGMFALTVSESRSPSFSSLFFCFKNKGHGHGGYEVGRNFSDQQTCATHSF